MNMATNQQQNNEFVPVTKPQVARLHRLLKEQMLPDTNKKFILKALKQPNLSKKGAGKIIFIAIKILEGAGVHRSTDSLILLQRAKEGARQNELPVEMTDEYITD
jgi:hypothetical protein